MRISWANKHLHFQREEETRRHTAPWAKRHYNTDTLTMYLKIIKLHVKYNKTNGELIGDTTAYVKPIKTMITVTESTAE